MNGQTLISTVERFFLDLIGTVLPGAILIGGAVAVVHPHELPGLAALTPPESAFEWAALVTISYVIGHVLASLSRILQRFYARICRWLRERGPWFAKRIPRSVRTEDELSESILKDRGFLQFVEVASPHCPWLLGAESADVHPARNLAISLVPGQEQRIFRFRFLSILNFGVATATVLLALFWVLYGVALDLQPLGPWAILAWVSGLVILSLATLERGFYFHSIAMRAQFSMATAALLTGVIPKSDSKAERKPSAGGLKIYLAGGFASGWQDQVTDVWQGTILDPRSHERESTEEYTLWDLEAIRACDWVLAYLEANNPGGFALALEVGFAKALGKRVILVDEKSQEDETLRRHLGMLRASADASFESLADALEFLETVNFSKLEG